MKYRREVEKDVTASGWQKFDALVRLCGGAFMQVMNVSVPWVSESTMSYFEVGFAEEKRKTGILITRTFEYRLGKDLRISTSNKLS